MSERGRESTPKLAGIVAAARSVVHDPERTLDTWRKLGTIAGAIAAFTAWKGPDYKCKACKQGREPMFDPVWEGRLHWLGTAILRYGLAFIFLRFGTYKFFPAGVTGVQAWTAHSLLLFWINPLLGPTGGRVLIGVIEIVTGILIALRPVAPRLAVVGGLMAAFAMLNTLSFLFTTPGLDARGSGFLIKDLVLLGAGIWSAAEASSAARNRRAVHANAIVK